jgi:hypothetical protein
MNFDKEILEEIVYMSPGESWEDYTIIENRMVDKTRWSIVHTTVFKFKDKFYAVDSFRPATESTDCDTWYGGVPEVKEVFRYSYMAYGYRTADGKEVL